MRAGEATKGEAAAHVSADGASAGLTRRFEHFLREQRAALVRFLYRRMPNREDAEDVAQESFMRLARYRETQPDESWKPLLYRIASNTAIDWQRQAQATAAAQHAPLEEVCDLASDAPALDARVEHMQELARIRELILGLPPRCREVYLLQRFEEMSYTQIARHLDISVKAVEKHMTRALVALRAGSGGARANPLRQDEVPEL